jgi:hypothetical protein
MDGDLSDRHPLQANYVDTKLAQKNQDFTEESLPPMNQHPVNDQYSHTTSLSEDPKSCPYHHKKYVAFCSLHSELVCEECCDLSHHRDHNNQILLLKAAAQNFM